MRHRWDGQDIDELLPHGVKLTVFPALCTAARNVTTVYDPVSAPVSLQLVAPSGLTITAETETLFLPNRQPAGATVFVADVGLLLNSASAGSYQAWVVWCDGQSNELATSLLTFHLNASNAVWGNTYGCCVVSPDPTAVAYRFRVQWTGGVAGGTAYWREPHLGVLGSMVGHTVDGDDWDFRPTWFTK